MRDEGSGQSLYSQWGGGDSYQVLSLDWPQKHDLYPSIHVGNWNQTLHRVAKSCFFAPAVHSTFFPQRHLLHPAVTLAFVLTLQGLGGVLHTFILLCLAYPFSPLLQQG